MAATHYYAVTDMTAIINPGGVNYTFDRANGTDQGSYVEPNGRFTVGCIRTPRTHALRSVPPEIPWTLTSPRAPQQTPALNRPYLGWSRLSRCCWTVRSVVSS